MDFDWAPGVRVLVDTSALVYLVEDAPSRGRAVSTFLEGVRSAGGRPFASVLVMAELLVRPLSRRDGETVLRYRRFLTDSDRLVLVPVDAEVSERAARILAEAGCDPRGSRRTARGPGGGASPRRGLSLADGIHIATAVVHGAAAVLTNDETWLDVPGIPRVFLVDEVLSEAV